jgi:hypothetical protein
MRNQVAQIKSLTIGGNMKLRLACLVLILLISTGFSFAQTESKASPNTNGFPHIVARIAVTQQTKTITFQPVFTPQKMGLFRLTGYMAAVSSTTPQEAGWSLTLEWTNQIGILETFSLVPYLNDPLNQVERSSMIFSPQPGLPIDIQIEPANNPQNSTYTLLVTIEQLE